MPRPAGQIAKDIEVFEPRNGDWRGLEEHLGELFQSESPETGISGMLRVFERFPVNEDGAGVFWSIVHGLESLRGYEKPLVRSVRSSPSEFGVIMVHRLLNSGVDEVAGVRLLPLLESITKNDSIPADIRSTAEKFLAKHRM